MMLGARVKGHQTVPPGQQLVFDHTTLEAADFQGCKVERFVAVGSRFLRCNLSAMTIKNASFGAGVEVTEYVDCNFDGSKISVSVVGRTRFVRCSFRNVIIRDLRCFTAEFVDCVFSGKLRVGFFNGAVPEEDRVTLGRQRNEFRGNDFSNMELIDVAFRTGIDLTQQKLPSGPQYLYIADGVRAIRDARAEIISWRDHPLRQATLALLSVLEDQVADGQEQLFLRINDFKSIDKSAAEALRGVFEKPGDQGFRVVENDVK